VAVHVRYYLNLTTLVIFYFELNTTYLSLLCDKWISLHLGQILISYFFLGIFSATRVDKINFRKYVITGKSSEVMRYIYYSLEVAVLNLHRVSNETGVDFISGSLVFNLGGYNPRSHACLRCKCQV